MTFFLILCNDGAYKTKSFDSLEKAIIYGANYYRFSIIEITIENDGLVISKHILTYEKK